MPPTLTEMPVPVMDLIFENVNFETIQVLRKVCHNFRSRIDNTQLDSKLSSAQIRADRNTYILMELHVGRRSYDITYDQKKKTECHISYKDRERKIENQDIGILAGNDFGLILQHQKTILDEFLLQFPRTKKSSKILNQRVLDSLEPHLKSRKSLLPTDKFRFYGTNQDNEIMKVLPFMDSEKLKRIEITNKDEMEKLPVLKMDEIVELEQWKNAKDVHIAKMYADTSLGSFQHFSNANFRIRTITLEDLVELRETLLNCSSLNTFEFKYRDFPDKKNLEKSFGKKTAESCSTKKIWHFKTPGVEQVLRVSWTEKKKMFKFRQIGLFGLPDFE